MTTRRSLATLAVVLLILVAGVALVYAVRAQVPSTSVSSTPSPSPTPTAGIVQVGPVAEHAVSLAVIDLGTRSDQPGVRQPIPPQTLALGPTSFALEGGRLYLWDQANLRVMIYELSASPTAARLAGSIALPTVPRDASGLLVEGTDLYLHIQQDDGKVLQEYHADSTGRIVATANVSRGEASIYPRARPGRSIFGPAKGVAESLGVDIQGFRYESLIILSGCPIDECRQFRRVRVSDGQIVTIDPRPLAGERDEYVSAQGGLYQLRWDRDPAPTRIEIVQFLAPLPSTATPQAGGSITGRFAYGSDFIPPVTVYAINANDQRVWFSVEFPGYGNPPRATAQPGTEPGTYTLTGVAPGTTYWVVAYRNDGQKPDPGVYTRASECLRRTPSGPCPDTTPVLVTVTAGQTTREIDIVSWYPESGLMPPPPPRPTPR